MTRCALALLSCVLPVFAGEYAVLSNGGRLHAERHEKDGECIVLFEKEGATRIPASQIASFEQEEYIAPAPAPPPALATILPAPAAKRQSALSPKDMLTSAAQRHEIPKELIHSVAWAESGFHPEAVSPKGAIGLMQLMPGTAAALNADPRNPEENADAGVRYLRTLLIKYQAYPDQVARALAAYNAGPGAVDKYNGVPPYRETVQYVRKVILKYKKDAGLASP